MGAFILLIQRRDGPGVPRVISRALLGMLAPGEISETSLDWESMSSTKATQLRPGMVIQHEGQLYTVFSVDHRTPGNKRGSMQTRMKNLRTGTMIDYRFRA